MTYIPGRIKSKKPKNEAIPITIDAPKDREILFSMLEGASSAIYLYHYLVFI